MTIKDQVTFTPHTDSPGVCGGPFGTVVGETVGPPDTADVLWENGQLDLAVPQAALSKVFPPVGFQAGRIGAWQRLNNFVFGAAGTTPKSPGAGGVLLGAFQLGAYGAGSADDPAYAVISQDNGRGRMLVVEDGAAVVARTQNVLIDGTERNS